MVGVGQTDTQHHWTLESRDIALVSPAASRPGPKPRNGGQWTSPPTEVPHPVFFQPLRSELSPYLIH